jgi:hypothetical protein
LQINLNGRRCGTLDFSQGAAHSCCIYDKTAEIAVSRKDWMQEVWKSNGWDGESRVTRVEFRYKRECLREMGSKRRTPSSISCPASGRTPPSNGCGTRSPHLIATKRAGRPHHCGNRCNRRRSSAMGRQPYVSARRRATCS